MKNMVNFKVLEQSIKLASKASDLERHCKDNDLSSLLHEVNLMALGIPNVVSNKADGFATEQNLEYLLNTIEGIRTKIDSLPKQSESVFEFARLLDQESELLLKYYAEGREVKRPLRMSRLAIQDRSRVQRSFSTKIGFQTSLF